ncbi:MAG: DUF1894 domain-containing protein [Methanoregulaceae archaeon]|nr:DUF1894 domain-containing protein [Methanoregulaceae archaeon]
MPEGPCFNQIGSKIFMKDVTPRRADNRVKKICHEYYRVEPGFVLRGVPLILTRAMLIGIDETSGRILVPFRKPCYGTSLYVIHAEREELTQIRTDLRTQDIAEQGKRAAARSKKTRGSQ